MPPGAIYVGRPTRWGNPWRVDEDFTPRDVVLLFAAALRENRLPFTASDVRRELRGRDLACWCAPGQPCHADVLLEVANAPE
jgi:hypothetical protein